MPGRIGTNRLLSLAAALAAVCVLIAIVGGVAARPISADMSLEGTLTEAGDGYSAFVFWIENWAGYYSHWAALNAGLSLFRAIGLDAYFFAAASICFVLLIVATCHRLWKAWSAGSRDLRPAVLIAAGLFGSFANLRLRSDPLLFEALYVGTVWMGHLVPIILLPFGLAWCLSPHERRRGLAGAALIGLVVAGFGLAESVIAFAGVVMTGWAKRRFDGRAAFRRHAPNLIAMAAAIALGAAVSVSLPGTRVRTVKLREAGDGIFAIDGTTAVVRHGLKVLITDLEHILLSPALLLGLAVGWALHRAAPPSADDARHRAKVIGIVLTVLLGVAWLAISAGDIVSYQAGWHLLPAWTLLYLLAAVAGWILADRIDTTALKAVARIALVTGVLWSTALTTVVARASWVRSQVFDQNLSSARAIAANRRPPPAVWRSMSIGKLQDVEPASAPNPWVRQALLAWLNLPEASLVVEPVAPPLYTIPLPTASFCRRLYICGD